MGRNELKRKRASGASRLKANRQRGMQTSQASQQGAQEPTEASYEATYASDYHAQPSQLDPKLKAIENNRASVYGDPKISHTAIGYTWRGILQNRFHDLVIPEINASLVAELLAGFKLTRASRPTFHQDSFDDLHVYVDFSERFRK